MLAEEIREMTAEDIRSRIAELEEERFRLRFRSATQSLEDPLRLRAVRRDIARLKTVLREREIAETQQAGAATAAARR
jgi:large subunit ribosomal protein L29